MFASNSGHFLIPFLRLMDPLCHCQIVLIIQFIITVCRIEKEPLNLTVDKDEKRKRFNQFSVFAMSCTPEGSPAFNSVGMSINEMTVVW